MVQQYAIRTPGFVVFPHRCKFKSQVTSAIECSREERKRVKLMETQKQVKQRWPYRKQTICFAGHHFQKIPVAIRKWKWETIAWHWELNSLAQVKSLCCYTYATKLELTLGCSNSFPMKLRYAGPPIVEVFNLII